MMDPGGIDDNMEKRCRTGLVLQVSDASVQ